MMKDLSYRAAPLLSTLPVITASAELGGVTVRLMTDNKPYWCNGSVWIDLSATADSRLTSARMSSDVSNNTVTLSNATGLMIALAANSHYALEAKVMFQTAALTTGIRLSQTVPAGATVAAQWNIPISLTASALSNQRAADTGTASTAVDAINANTLATASILVITAATAGNIQIRFASEVAASNVVIKAGSHLVATRVI
ncbi:hypothetical protein ACFQNF_19595 [Iodobacter arcticus]|uniref:Uncharacterized protein n=1 Tax=Iodobacter arcticus TaxID=590593 RepID=A0ABW2R2D4_9NEIS